MPKKNYTIKNLETQNDLHEETFFLIAHNQVALIHNDTRVQAL